MCDTLAETIRDGIRYSLHHDDWDTAALLRDYADIIPDALAVQHNGTLSQFSADLIRSLVFDGVAYATAERWTAEGFVVIDSISGISLMDGPEQTLEYAIDEFLACDEFLA